MRGESWIEGERDAGERARKLRAAPGLGPPQALGDLSVRKTDDAHQRDDLPLFVGKLIEGILETRELLLSDRTTARGEDVAVVGQQVRALPVGRGDLAADVSLLARPIPVTVEDLAQCRRVEPRPERGLATVLLVWQLFEQLATHRLHEIAGRLVAAYSRAGSEPDERAQPRKLPNEELLDRQGVTCARARDEDVRVRRQLAIFGRHR